MKVEIKMDHGLHITPENPTEHHALQWWLKVGDDHGLLFIEEYTEEARRESEVGDG